MASENLDKGLVADPSQWRMAMCIAPGRVDMLVSSISGESSVLHRRIQLDTPLSESLSALDEAVYANQLVLSDFASSDVLIDTSRFMVIPEEEATDEMCAASIEVLWPNMPLASLVSHCHEAGVSVVYGVPERLLSFVRRTFPSALINHRMWPLLAFFASRKRSLSRKMYINIHDNSADIVIIGPQGLLAASSYTVGTVDDIIYYTTALGMQCGVDFAADDIMLCGSIEDCGRLAPALGRYAANVSTIPLASVLPQVSPDLSNLPFELILPLCV